MNNFANSSELQILLEKAVDNSPGAFSELAQESTDRLKNLTRAMLRQYPRVRRWEDTDDVYQATLIRLHRSLADAKPESTREYFGLAVTQIRRSLIDLARHYYGPLGVGKNHHSEVGGIAADDSGGYLNRRADSIDQPENLWQWTQFHEAIGNLPEDEREVFSLTWYGGLKRKEVAKLLCVAEKTVIRRLNRARILLHQVLSGQKSEG